jgi:hypothetical protein
MSAASANPQYTTKTALQTTKQLTAGTCFSMATATALTNASTVAVDLSVGNYFTLATTSAVGAVALTMTNHTPGQPVWIVFSATGGAQVVTFSTGVNYVSSTLSVTQDKSFVVCYICDSTRAWEVSRTTAITVA